MPDLRATVETVCSFARRGPCTDAERRAALRLHDDLRQAGHEAWVETYWVRPQWPTSLLLHSTIGVVASLLATAYPLPALLAAVVAALSYGLEVSGRGGLLRLAFFRRATQVVVVEPPDPDRIALLITARTDAPRQGLVFRDGVRRLGARLGRGAIPSAAGWVVLSLLAVAGAAAARLAGAEGPAVGAPQFLPTLVLLLAAAAALDVALSVHGPGAGDAAAVAVALAVHDALVRDPPRHLSPGLLLAGAGEAFPLGLRAHLRRERPRPAATVLVEIGPCAAGAPAYSSRAGVLFPGRLHHQLAAACEWTKAELPELRARPAPQRGPSATQAARARGLPAVGIRAVDGTGVPPRWRTPSDRAELVDRAAMAATAEFTLAMVEVLDADLGVQPD